MAEVKLERTSVAGVASAPYLVIADSLRRRIQNGELQPGDPLPSYREMAESHGVTAVTLRKAIMSLQFEGLIKTVSRSGSVVAKASKWNMLGLVSIGGDVSKDSPPLTNLLSSLHGELDRVSCDLSVRCISKDDPDALAGLVSWAQRLDGVILMWHVPANIARAIADTGTPVVLCGEPSDGPCPPEVANISFDTRSTIHLAVSHLVSLGHRRIALCSGKGTRYFDMVSQLFSESAAEYGLANEVSDWYFDFENPSRWPELIDWLDARPQAPTALLIEDANRAAALMPILQTRGWAVPERLSVLAIAAWDKPWVMDGLSNVLCSIRGGLLRAAKMLPEMIRNPRLIRVETVAPTYVHGRTCRPLPPQD